MAERSLVFLSADTLYAEEKSSRHPLLLVDDEPLVDALAQRDYAVTFADWMTTPPRMLDGATVLVRTPWNYTDHLEAFETWIREAEDASVRLINPAALLLGTLRKTYLMDLPRLGVPAIPTLPFEPGPGGLADTDEALAHARAAFRTDSLVIKPAVGAGARNTVLLRSPAAEAPAHAGALAALPQDQDYLVQPFVPEIETAGEISVVFFGGRFAHMVQKRPKAGDFRVQTEHGGHTTSLVPDRMVVARAARASALFADPAYIRVDGVVTEQGFLVMELEMIEPELFFGFAPDSATLFADVLAGLLGDRE
ncbi:MAG: RimK family alpha-L-glutamate ligase [Alphaproteobacteria bacterium]